MTPEVFKEILARYNKGRATAEEEKLIDTWFTAIGNDQESSFTSSDDEIIENRYLDRLNKHVLKGRQRSHAAKVIWWPAVGIAATLALVIVSFVYLQQKPASIATPALGASTATELWRDVKNASNAASSVRLPDGSKITLQPGGSLRFLESFNAQEREVYLEGNAFFEVKRDIARPFLVYTGKVVTKVLGTSFTIDALPGNENIVVAVKTGKVSVYTRKESESSNQNKHETILVPNQQAIYNLIEDKVHLTLIDNPQPVLEPEEVAKVIFDDAPVADILDALSKIYAVKINYDKETLHKCKLTTSVPKGVSIYNRLDIICKAIGATYAVEGTIITIAASGCD